MKPVIIAAILISTLLTKCQAQAQTLNNYNRPSLVRIGIIDTGYGAFDFDYAGRPLKLCNSGHYDYSTNRATVGAVHPHGTIIGSIIANELKDIDYCAVIYNVWNHHANKINKTALIDAINRAAKENLTAVNLSIEGFGKDAAEQVALTRLSKTTKIFIAAGNGALNLSYSCNVFPACYKLPSIVVGAVYDNKFKGAPSNYGGPVQYWANGEMLWNGRKVRGTSFATPRVLSNYILLYTPHTQMQTSPQLQRSKHLKPFITNN